MKSIVTKTRQRGKKDMVWLKVIKNWLLQGKNDSLYYQISIL